MTLEAFFYDAKAVSLVAVTLTFLLIVAYALWPSRQASFDAAARLPLNED
jgi:cbb3-type cytochrome oxidase subunit 3